MIHSQEVPSREGIFYTAHSHNSQKEKTMDIVRGERISNFHDVVRRLDQNPSTAVLVHALVTHDEHLLVRDPFLDAYLVRMSAVWSHGCEAYMLTTPLLPGILHQHYSPLGFTPRVVDMPRNREALRHGDPVRYLLENGGINGHFPDNAVFFPSFATDDLVRLGRTLVTPEATRQTNSKTAMHEAAQRFDFSMPPGVVIHNIGQAQAYARTATFPLWLKADGSGSDYVIKVRNADEVKSAIAEMMQRVIAGAATLPEEFLSGPFRENLHLWETGLEFHFLPADLDFPFPLLLQQSVETLGRIRANLCWQFLLNGKRAWEVGYSEQIISPDGDEWWGSRSSDFVMPDSGYEQAQKLLDWYSSTGYQGLVGPDVMVVEDDSGELKFYFIDPNGRPAMSTTAFIAANALLAGLPGGWINTNITLPRAVEHFDDLAEQVGRQLLSPGGENGVQGVVLATRTEADEPSKVVKLLLVSPDGADACAAMRDTLRSERNIRIGS